MLDNKEINEQFTNDSWEKMRLLLDAEMPVDEQRRKRPVIWFWPRTIGIAATILLTGAGIWWLTTGVPMQDDASGVVMTETVTGSGNGASAQLENGEQVQSRLAEAAVQPSDEAALSDVAPKVQHREPAGNTAFFNLADASHANRQEQKASATIIATAESIQNQTAVSIANTTTPFLENEAANIIATLPMPDLTPLAGVDPALLPAREPVLQASVIPAEKLSASWRHGPEMGGIMSFPASLTGFNAGWAAEIPLGNGLALHGAMRYDYQRQTVTSEDRQARLESSVDVAFDSDPFNPASMVGSTNITPDTVFSSTLKMHYAALPLSLSMRVSDRWRVEGGMQVAYLLRAFRESRNSENAFAGTQDMDLFNNRSWYFSNKVQQVASESFQPWDFAVSAGVRYQFTRNWHLGLSGNFGLLNQASKSNGYRIFNRNAVLSLGYYF